MAHNPVYHIPHMEGSLNALTRGLLALSLLFSTTPGRAVAQIDPLAALVVNTTDDELNADGDCSLREAIRAANLDVAVDACPAGSGADTITLPAGAYLLTLPGTGEDAAVTGDLDITTELTITGPDAATTIIDGNALDRVFHVVYSTTVTLSNITIQNGLAQQGGGLNNAGVLTVENSVVRSNDASGSGYVAGGGVFNADNATLTVISSLITGNRAISADPGSGNGGGLATAQGGVVTVAQSEISGNNASWAGGGLLNGVSGTLTLNDSAITGNSAGYFGGGLFGQSGTFSYLNNSTVSKNNSKYYVGGLDNFGILSLNSTTVTENTAKVGAGGIQNGYGTAGPIVNLQNSILFGNTAPSSPNCLYKITSGGHNLLGNTAGCSVTPAASDQTGVDPKLGQLIGSPGYHPLLSASPAIDGGDPGGCTGSDGPLPADQRGASRIGVCDIGAYEYTVPGPAASLSARNGTPQRAAPLHTFELPFEVVVLDAVGSPVGAATVTFSAPLTGASGYFEDSGTPITVSNTAEDGTAESALLVANDTLGEYSVLATVSGVALPAVFSLINVHWFVSPEGTDANDCMTALTPCATIRGALDKAGEGDFVYVASGKYSANAGAEVVLLQQSAVLSGGWMGAFNAQTGVSIVDGGGARRGITVDSTVTATMDRFRVQNGNATDGGGIWNSGNLTLLNSSIAKNVASAHGAGIYNDGFVGPGALEIINTSIHDNATPSLAGGIYFNGGTATLTNATLSSNSANYGAGGIYAGNAARLLLNNSTITQNSITTSSAGGIGNSYPNTVFIQNSILAGNIPADCQDQLTSLGYSLVGVPCTYFVSGPGDLIGVPPHFALPEGEPSYLPLLPASPAVDSGNPAAPGSGGTACAPTDTRGIPRPKDGDGAAGPRCDMGAFEYVPPLVVNTLADGNDANPGDGMCETAPGNKVCTLRAAIQETNAAPGVPGEEIVSLGAGTYTLSISGRGEDFAATGDLDILGNLRILGAGMETVIDAIGLDRVFEVLEPESVVGLSDLTFKNGDAESLDGGGIRNLGRLTLSDAMALDNTAGSGGGVFNEGTLTLRNSTLAGNKASATAAAGSGLNNQGQAVVANSTFSGNESLGSGGGIFNASGGTASLNNVTLTGNSADADNNGDGGGGGIAVAGGGALAFSNTILSGNSDPSSDPDCYGTLISNDYNLIQNESAGCNIVGEKGHTFSGYDALLGSLHDNGGLTLTHALLKNSPALDAGNNDTCEVTDQRGAGRPVTGIPGNPPLCDVGAFELGPSAAVSDPVVLEGDSGTTNAVFEFSLSVPTTVEIAIPYKTANGSARSPQDYLPASGTLVIPSGATSGEVAVTVKGDNAEEPIEEFYLNLGRASGGVVLEKKRAVGTIFPDDYQAYGVYSRPEEDGWVLEASEDSGRGGKVESGGPDIHIGDDNANRQYRAILSFDTSYFPDDVQIIFAVVYVRRHREKGTSPFATLAPLLADIRRGSFGGNALETSDFQSRASLSEAAIMSPPKMGSPWSTGLLAGTPLKYIDKKGKTQVRLRFWKDDDNDRNADYVDFFSGEVYYTSKPILIVAVIGGKSTTALSADANACAWLPGATPCAAVFGEK